MNKKKQLTGSLCLILATIIWGSSFVSQSVGMDYVGPFTFQAIRCCMAFVGLLPVIFLSDKIQRKKHGFIALFMDKQLWKAAICCAIPLFAAVNLQQIGIVSTDAGKSAFLTAMYIIFVPLIGIILRKKTSQMIPVSVMLAIVGLYFLSCFGATSVQIGDVYLLGCALAFAMQIIFVDKYASQVDPLRLNCLQAGLASFGSQIMMLLTESPTLAGIQGSWWPMCYSGFLSMGIAFSLQIIGQKYLESSVASLIMSLESVFAVLCGWLLLNQMLTVWEGIGCCLVFIAVILAQIPCKNASKVK